MVSDLVIAAVITLIAVVLGITVHPLLLLLIIFAILFLVLRRR